MKRYYLCITPFFPSPQSFVGPYVLNQVKALSRCSDYRVIVLKPCSFLHNEEDYTYDGVPVYRFKDYTLPSNAYPNALSDKLSVRSLLHKLNKIGININDIAVCHSHVTHLGMYANALKRLNPSIKSVVQHHGFDVMKVTDGIFANHRWHEHRCIKYGVKICNDADLNIGVSQRTLNYVLEQPGIHLKDSYVLYNGIDTSLFSPTAIANPKSDTFLIGCVANFWELKDQITLIKAVHRLVKNGETNLKVIFIGSGYTRQMCEDYIRQNSLDSYFEFRKEVMNDKLPDFYRSLDLFVLPSYWEAFGCVYIEAYSCGVPFIGVKGQGISEIIPKEDADKWLIDKGDDATLAQLIRRNMIGEQANQKLSISVDADSLITEYLQNIK